MKKIYRIVELSKCRNGERGEERHGRRWRHEENVDRGRRRPPVSMSWWCWLKLGALVKSSRGGFRTKGAEGLYDG